MSRTRRLKSHVLAASSAGAIGVALAAGAAAPAMAQAVTTQDRVVVTGSRISRDTDFTTPVPTTVLGGEELDNLGIVNAGDALIQIPSNVSTFQPTATGNSNFFAGSILPNLRGLNPFFGSRTLTLVDTRRHVQTNQGDGVDLNFIPSILIDRIETVTGGASAAYGSGAIAGVTNILLDRDFVGAQIELDYGVTEEGDGDDYHAAAKYGAEFAGGRGHLVLGGEYQDSSVIGCQTARDWCALNIGYISNAGAADGAQAPGIPEPMAANRLFPGLPQNIRFGNLRANQTSTTGVFVGTGLEANAAGTGTDPFDIGGPSILANGAGPISSSATVVGGDGLPINQYTNLRSPVERYIGNALLRYELSPGLNAFLEASYGEVETVNVNQGSVLPGTGFTRGQVAADNYYAAQNPALLAALNASLAAAPATLPAFTGGPRAAPGPYARFGKDWTGSTGTSETLFNTQVLRIAGGLDGDVNFGPLEDWGWNVYGTYGRTERVQMVENLRTNLRYLMATDVVADAAGNPVCRVTRNGTAPGAGGLHPEVAAAYTSVIDELAQGCVPLNVFGSGAIDPAAHAYAFGALREDLTYEQTVFAANADGDLFDGFGAGPIQLAVGVEYRHENGVNAAGMGLPSPANTVGGATLTDAERADFGIQYGEPFSGIVDVYEAYAELNVPLLSDRPFFNFLEVNGAIRQSRYENESTTAFSLGATSKHNLTTWKLSGIWEPVDWLRFRGSFSHDARAPNFRELYYRQIIPAGGFFGQIQNPFIPNTGPGSQTDLLITDLQGNVAVEPEESDTWTIGGVLSPAGRLDGFQFAVDYYNIELENRITPASTIRTLNGCAQNNDPAFCALIFDVNGTPLTDPAAIRTDLSRYVAQAFNGVGYRTNGVDFTASYFTSLGDDRSLSIRILASRILDQFFNDGVNAYDYSGETGGGGFLADFQSAPDWQGNATATYMQGPLTVTGQVRWVGASKINWEWIDPSDPGYDENLTLTTFDNSLSDYFLFGLNASWAFEDLGFNGNGVELWASVNNVFNTDPPVFGGAGLFASFTGSAAGTNPIFYDVLGRSFRFGVRADF